LGGLLLLVAETATPISLAADAELMTNTYDDFSGDKMRLISSQFGTFWRVIPSPTTSA
jgi:hypothetical protein